tara:strand:- start:30 stop:242 length:213 start_codon:yes stop_codon:yes gene_type:complete
VLYGGSVIGLRLGHIKLKLDLKQVTREKRSIGKKVRVGPDMVIEMPLFLGKVAYIKALLLAVTLTIFLKR